MKSLLSKFTHQVLSREQMKSVRGGWHCVTVSCFNSQQYAQNHGHACGHTDAQRREQAKEFAQHYCNSDGRVEPSDIPING